MELTPLERRIKAAALIAIRKVKPWEIETSMKKVAFMSLCDNVYDVVYFDKETGEYSVSYDVNTDMGLQTRELTFRLVNS